MEILKFLVSADFSETEFLQSRRSPDFEKSGRSSAGRNPEKLRGGDVMAIRRLKDLEESERDYLTVSEVSEVLGISPATVRKQVEQQDIPIIKIGRNYRILKEPFMRLMQANSADTEE